MKICYICGRKIDKWNEKYISEFRGTFHYNCWKWSMDQKRKEIKKATKIIFWTSGLFIVIILISLIINILTCV